MSRAGLTAGAAKKDALALDLLRRLAATTQIGPTNDDLMHAIGGNSWATASVCIRRLEAAGLIEVRRTACSRVIVIDGVELGPAPRQTAGSGKAIPVPRRRNLQRVISARSDDAKQQVPVLPLPESLTALICGDPVPGRSARPSSIAYRSVPVGPFPLAGGCQFIAADTDLGSAPKCGRPRVTVGGRDSPYCGAHHAVCYERWSGAKPGRLTPDRNGAK